MSGLKEKLVERKVEELIPYERNQKKHDEKQVQNIANSLKRFGQKQPIVIDSKDVVVIGHGRLLAAKKLGWETVDCVVADDLTEDEIRELRIVDNKTNESPWDIDALSLDMEQLSFDGFDLDFGVTDGMQHMSDGPVNTEPSDFKYKERYGVIVMCDGEQMQKEVYDMVTEMGYECKVVCT